MIIAVARDEAFNFTYRENIDRLREWGEVVFFSPIHDSALPACDFLYLPGGYPEFFLPSLTENASMRRQIHEYIEQGGRCFAECGGMMYLCTAIIDTDGTRYPMVDILHQHATMQGMRLHLGYREWNGFPGHEFHYSHIVEEGDVSPSKTLPHGIAGQVRNEGLQTLSMPHPSLYIYKNLRASYIHLYWGEKNLFDLWND